MDTPNELEGALGDYSEGRKTPRLTKAAPPKHSPKQWGQSMKCKLCAHLNVHCRKRRAPLTTADMEKSFKPKSDAANQPDINMMSIMRRAAQVHRPVEARGDVGMCE